MEDEPQIYADETPDIPDLADAYARTVNDLGTYLAQCQQNRDDLRNEWVGKTADQRKNGEDAFPWKGASDQEVHVIAEREDALMALACTSMGRSHIKANAVKMESLPRASSVTAFARWMKSTYIRDFQGQFEKACSHGLNTDLMIGYVGWEKRERTFMEEMDLEEIRAQAPDFAGMIESGADDDKLAALLIQGFPKLPTQRAKKAIRDLRKTGKAELYVTKSEPLDSRPIFKACAPDREVFFPPYCEDPQEAPYVFWRQTYTAQQLENKASGEGWDEDWVKLMIANYRGTGVETIGFDKAWTSTTPALAVAMQSNNDLVLVVHAFRRLIDPDTGSEGIYETVFCPCYTGDNDAPAYAMHRLLNGRRTYPFAFKRMSMTGDGIYDAQALPQRLRGAQFAVKVERDSRADRNALATLPPREGPAGREPSDWGPGRYIPVRRRGEVGYVETPQYNPGSVEMEQTILKMADNIACVDPENPLTPVKQQHFVNKTLEFGCEVLRMAYECFQLYGPDEIFFTVTGVPDPITIQNVSQDDFDFTLTFDTLQNDPDYMKAQMEGFGMLMQQDVSGRIDRGKYTEFAAYTLNPSFANHVLLPAEENQQKLIRSITDDLTKISAGIAVGAQPNGAQVALQVIQQWMQEQDVAERYQGDEAFTKRVDDYAKQYQMQMMQAENAQTGRLGTAPTAFQGTNIGAA